LVDDNGSSSSSSTRLLSSRRIEGGSHVAIPALLAVPGRSGGRSQRWPPRSPEKCWKTFQLSERSILVQPFQPGATADCCLMMSAAVICVHLLFCTKSFDYFQVTSSKPTAECYPHRRPQQKTNIQLCPMRVRCTGFEVRKVDVNCERVPILGTYRTKRTYHRWTCARILK
jgi:hypothetical protein